MVIPEKNRSPTVYHRLSFKDTVYHRQKTIVICIIYNSVVKHSHLLDHTNHKINVKRPHMMCYTVMVTASIILGWGVGLFVGYTTHTDPDRRTWVGESV